MSEMHDSITSSDVSSSPTEHSMQSLIQYALTSKDYLDQFIPLIRSELQTKGNLQGLLSGLENTTKQKQSTLEDISFESVDDLTNSVEKIKTIVKSSSSLSKNLTIINKQIDDTGRSFAKDKRKALDYKKLASKINETSFTINFCLDVLERTNRVLDLVRSKDFYKALINLQLLARTNFDEIKQFDFSVGIYNSIPTFKKMIVEETFNQLIKWMNISLEKRFPDIGEILFDNCKSVVNSWTRRQAGNKQLLPFKINSPIERMLRDNKYKTLDPLSNDMLQIDMGPLFHSILVFQSVDKLDKLKEDFGNEILRRRDRLIYPIREAMANNNFDMLSTVESIKILMFSMSAFFISDRYITRKTHYQLRSAKQNENMFDSVITKFALLLEKFIARSVDSTSAQSEQLAIYLGSFIQILTDWKYDASKLFDVLIHLFKIYIKESIESFRSEYMSLSLDDDSQPITVHSEEQLSNVCDSCFYKYEDHNHSFPKTLPYSVIYPGACLRLRSLIYQMYNFIAVYYDRKLDVLLRMISNAVDSVLIDVILKDLDNKVHSSYKEEVSQNLINLEFFTSSIPAIENYLNTSTDPIIMKSRIPSITIKLKAQDAFERARLVAERGMFSMVDGKVDLLFGMVDFDWDSKIVNDEPSISIKDMGLYLQNMFKLDFSHLPYTMRTHLLIRSFDKIATQLKQSIFGADGITSEGVQNFEIDINYLESLIPDLRQANGRMTQVPPEFAKSDDKLQAMFVGLRQIIALLKDGNLDKYEDPELRTKFYGTIQPKDAKLLIEKLDSYQMLMNSPTKGTNKQFDENAADGDGRITDTKSLFSNLKRTATTTSFSGFSLRK